MPSGKIEIQVKFLIRDWWLFCCMMSHVWKVMRGVNTIAHNKNSLMEYRASVQTILFSKWSRVSPLGQAPISMSLNTICRPPPLIEAASMRGKVASQSVQKRTLGEKTQRHFLVLMADCFYKLKLQYDKLFNPGFPIDPQTRSYGYKHVWLYLPVAAVSICINKDNASVACPTTAPVIQCDPKHLWHAFKWEAICFIMTLVSRLIKVWA